MLDEAVVDCIIEDSRPFGDFSKPGMKKFLNKAIPGYSAPSRFTIKRKINENIKNSENQLKRFLQISKILP